MNPSDIIKLAIPAISLGCASAVKPPNSFYQEKKVPSATPCKHDVAGRFAEPTVVLLATKHVVEECLGGEHAINFMGIPGGVRMDVRWPIESSKCPALKNISDGNSNAVFTRTIEVSESPSDRSPYETHYSYSLVADAVGDRRAKKSGELRTVLGWGHSTKYYDGWNPEQNPLPAEATLFSREAARWVDERNSHLGHDQSWITYSRGRNGYDCTSIDASSMKYGSNGDYHSSIDWSNLGNATHGCHIDMKLGFRDYESFEKYLADAKNRLSLSEVSPQPPSREDSVRFNAPVWTTNVFQNYTSQCFIPLRDFEEQLADTTASFEAFWERAMTQKTNAQ